MHSEGLTRRNFITALGCAAASPVTARAQQPSTPVIGFLRSTPAAPFAQLVAAFRLGLRELGLIEGENVNIEQRWADNDPGRLPALAADLVSRRVAVIVGNGPAMLAAKSATSTIPIVFVVGDDPVSSGLVASLNRPGGNLTGVTFFGGSQLGPKRMELLHELVPKSAVVAVLVDPNYAGFVRELPDLEAAGRSVGRQVVEIKAENERELDTAFAKVEQAGAGALLVSGGPFFTSQRHALVALAARHAIPAIYDVREFVEAGGLMSYSASISDAYRQAGIYAGRILKGTKPSELPVQRPTRFELVINLKTAKALGLEVPPTLLARADEVME
jgi:putative tryptophan/tyrosine transport system substrate-binding protein